MQTGRSKGFAFIEFECDEVAKIVAESMNNYLLFNKLLQCRCGLLQSRDVYPKLQVIKCHLRMYTRECLLLLGHGNSDQLLVPRYVPPRATGL